MLELRDMRICEVSTELLTMPVSSITCQTPRERVLRPLQEVFIGGTAAAGDAAISPALDLGIRSQNKLIESTR